MKSWIPAFLMVALCVAAGVSTAQQPAPRQPTANEVYAAKLRELGVCQQQLGEVTAQIVEGNLVVSAQVKAAINESLKPHGLILGDNWTVKPIEGQDEP